MIGLILAAGEGKRLNNHLKQNVSKPLVKINCKCLIEYSLQNCVNFGIKTVIVVVNPNNKFDIYSMIGDEFNGMKIIYAVQKEPKGLINAVMSASEYLDDCIMLQLSDEIFIKPKVPKCTVEYENGADFIVTYVYESDKEKIKNNFSIETDETGNIVNCIEKPEIIINAFKGTGLCFFNFECIKLLKSHYDCEKNYPDNLCDYFNFLIKCHKIGKTCCIAEEEINVNTTAELNYAQMRIRDEKEQ